MTRGLKLFFAFVLAICLFGGISAALADENLNGDWSGTWQCPGCAKTSGAMNGHITQNGQDVTGHCVMENTGAGTITGGLVGTASGGTFDAIITTEKAGEIDINGSYQGNTIHGSYLSDMGDGTFTLNR